MEEIPKVKEIALEAVSVFGGGRLDPARLPFLGMAGTVWLIMFCHMWSLRRTLSRVFFVVSQMQSQLDSVKWQVDVMKTSVDAVTTSVDAMTTGIRDAASSTSPQRQEPSDGEDVPDLGRAVSHVALTAAVNLVLDKGSSATTTLAASSTTIPTISTTASVVQELKDALDPLGQRMRALRDTLDTGLAGVTRQLADMDQTSPNLKPIQDSLKDLATRQETMVPVTDKNLEETKVQVTNKVLGAHQELVDLLSVLKGLSEKHREQVEKFEMAFRGKLTSITEELQTLKGQANNLHGTSHGLLRGLQKGVDHQANSADSTATTMAAIAAAFSKLPIDSPGIGKILDNVLSLAELVKEQESHFSQINEHMSLFDTKLHDVKEKLPERPPYRVPPAEQSSGSQTARTRLKFNRFNRLESVLEVMTSKLDDERLQRACLQAVGRLAKDVSKLRPLCLGVVSAIAASSASMRHSLNVQRMAIGALSSVAYSQDVATLIAPLGLPVVLEAALSHPSDSKLQGLMCEAFARLAQGGGEAAMVKCIVASLETPDVALSMLCDALQRLCENAICQPRQVVDELLHLCDSDPSNLELQRQVSLCLHRLLAAGVVSEACVRGRGTLLNSQWAHLLERFLGAEDEEAKLDGTFHSKVQELFHQEVALHFEYEAAERCLHYLRRRTQPSLVFLEVIRCLAENLEDYQSRSEARELAWDAGRQMLVPLDPHLRLRLQNEVLEAMQLRLPQALCSAALAAADWPKSEESLVKKTAHLLNECSKLLERKTQVTQDHHERAAELRREVMLFEAVEYLELNAAEATPTQVSSALHMLEVATAVAPADALERLRYRLGRLTAKVSPKAETFELKAKRQHRQRARLDCWFMKA
ncbi:hypothetical protein AK812_SmicGene35856 [Symbiodinium microadriaticum]|uniref:Uncharacterized protein n=1 Tax=Symbiodinium microadriaticum TaxID=2951 RepID=A0A1Q9CKE1_SYMMI|nr:hypothetical protein AK812_SmicGene35856 [Symbiodinium microadriaticum]CAE7897602.1 unnamed protein product [Symbiodinium microadriaticum]